MAVLVALAFLALALARPKLGLRPVPLAGLVALVAAAVGWGTGLPGKANAAGTAAAFVAAWGACYLHDEAPAERLVRAGMLLLGAAALWSLPPYAASVATGPSGRERPDLVEVQVARLSIHHPTTWRSSEADGGRRLEPRDVGDAWIALRPAAADGALALEAALKPLAAKQGAAIEPRVRGDLVGYQARTLTGDATLLFWGCEAFPAPGGQALLVEYGVRRSSADPRKRIRELEATLATLQPGD